MGGVLGLRELAMIPKVPEAMGEIPDEIRNNDLFEGYQSKSDDEFFSDFDDEGDDSKLATVMDNNLFKKLVGCPIRFEVGQTHDSVCTLRGLLTDHAIHEGFNFKKIKNDKNRLTWAYLVENFPWRLHASIDCDETTMQAKIYSNDHTCHRIYKSQEAKAKWIATQKKGFLKGCRPFISIDGCHLKMPYGGVLPSAIALYANSGMYLIAYCICEGETILSWSWFSQRLRCFLNYPEYRPICFISDMQMDVIWTLNMYWPKASIRHAFDNSIKFDHVTNNITEAFNSMLKDFRSMTYLGLKEYIRRIVMSRFQLRQEECSRWGNGIPPAVNKKIKDNTVKCRILRTLHSCKGKYEMLGLNRVYTANLNEKTCECGQRHVSGVSCCHALVGIRHHFGVYGNQNNIEEFIDPALSKSAYLRTYNYMIYHIPDMCVWGDHEGAHIEPPPLKRKPRRPKLLRKRE
ncbi:hypothetical protein Dsin_025390 [Dipteronia sinensis]|uniref:SWIM-type domain-containing protein n=1 Tax=Dipteronia sinensis TaxID=43782 RepID=A0AAD9ZW18_9ROSI|nr:hypothetical protein Dsin_025390 [Dipteronia sinensis]